MSSDLLVLMAQLILERQLPLSYVSTHHPNPMVWCCRWASYSFFQLWLGISQTNWSVGSLFSFLSWQGNVLHYTEDPIESVDS